MKLSRPPVCPPERIAVSAKQLATMLGLSLRTIRTMDAAGKLPRPVKLGARSVRWRVRDIDDWLAAGCPGRAQWEAVRDELGRAAC